MTEHQPDLVAVREALAPRASDGDGALPRSWTTIGARLAARDRAATAPGTARWLVPAGVAATVTALALGTVVVLGGGTGEPPPAGPRDFPWITDPEEIVFPIDEYDFTAEGYLDFTRAAAHLQAECLRRFGVDVRISDDPGTLPEFNHRRRFGVFDLAVAAEHGYRPPPRDGATHATGSDRPDLDVRRADGWDPTEEELFLLEGRSRSRFADRSLPVDGDGDPLPSDGCLGEVARILSGGMTGVEGPNWQVRNNDAETRAGSDPRVAAAEAAWSRCMARAGYDYRSIWEPNDRVWPDPPGPQEIATAVADVDCKIETNLVGVWVAVISEYQEAYIQNNWDELQELKRWHDTVQRNAEQVLAEAERSK